METSVFFFFFILTIIMAASAFSQPSGMGMGMKKWKGEVPCWRASDLDLSQEQRKGLDLIQMTFFREAQLLRAQLFAKRLELRELLTNTTIRMESIRVKNLEIIELQSKQEEKTIEYLIKVRNLLTPEQLKNWCPEQEFPSFRERMHGMGPMGSTPPKRILPPTE